ncbi:hypothetical protein V8B97DRAFT_2006169 [Scleroderma yunnanense]
MQTDGVALYAVYSRGEYHRTENGCEVEGYLWDFQHIGVLPRPFQTYAFFNINNPFAAAVGNHLGHQPSDIANAMTKASALLQQIGGDADLGKYSSSIIGT